MPLGRLVNTCYKGLRHRQGFDLCNAPSANQASFLQLADTSSFAFSSALCLYLFSSSWLWLHSLDPFSLMALLRYDRTYITITVHSARMSSNICVVYCLFILWFVCKHAALILRAETSARRKQSFGWAQQGKDLGVYHSSIQLYHTTCVLCSAPLVHAHGDHSDFSSAFFSQWDALWWELKNHQKTRQSH